MSRFNVPIDTIKVGIRTRRDLGDLGPLCESMTKVGLLHPIVVDADHKLVAGARRLAAAKRIGWSFIDIKVIELLSDAVMAIRAEGDENTCRLDLTPSEAIAQGQRLEELLGPRARERMVAAHASPGNLPELERGDVRDQVGDAVGMSGRTYEKAKAVVQAASDPEQPAEVREVAQAAVEEMDRTGKVEPAYRKVSEVKKESASVSTFNFTNENISWAAWSWNPVTGCKHGCPYCYARDIGMRFNGTFEPQFHPERLSAPANTRPKHDLPGGRNVFVGSMCDLFGVWVPQEWIDAVLAECAKPDNVWRYLFLTKNPARLATITWPGTCWVGATVDTQARVAPTEEAFARVTANIKWLSCEPLREPLIFSRLDLFDWVVIGAQSESTKEPAKQPHRDWVYSLMDQARAAGCRIYLKPNLTAGVRERPER